MAAGFFTVPHPEALRRVGFYLFKGNPPVASLQLEYQVSGGIAQHHSNRVSGHRHAFGGIKTQHNGAFFFSPIRLTCVKY